MLFPKRELPQPWQALVCSSFVDLLVSVENASVDAAEDTAGNIVCYNHDSGNSNDHHCCLSACRHLLAAVPQDRACVVRAQVPPRKAQTIGKADGHATSSFLPPLPPDQRPPPVTSHISPSLFPPPLPLPAHASPPPSRPSPSTAFSMTAPLPLPLHHPLSPLDPEMMSARIRAEVLSVSSWHFGEGTGGGLPVDDGIHQDLDGVAVGQQVDDVERVPHDAHLQMPHSEPRRKQPRAVGYGSSYPPPPPPRLATSLLLPATLHLPDLASDVGSARPLTGSCQGRLVGPVAPFPLKTLPLHGSRLCRSGYMAGQYFHQ